MHNTSVAYTDHVDNTCNHMNHTHAHDQHILESEAWRSAHGSIVRPLDASMSLLESCVDLHSPRHPARKRQRVVEHESASSSAPRGPRGAAYLHDYSLPGPHRIVGIIGSAGGRYHSSLTSDSDRAFGSQVDTLLQTLDASVEFSGSVACPPPGQAALFGLVVVRSWEFCLDIDALGSDPDEPILLSMKKALMHSRDSRSSVGFIKYLVCDHAVLDHPVVLDSLEVELHSVAFHNIVSSQGMATLLAKTMDAEIRQGWQRVSLNELVSSWKHKYSLCTPYIVGWQAHWKIAKLLVLGELSCDIVPYIRRDRNKIRLTPTEPSENLESCYFEFLKTTRNPQPPATLPPAATVQMKKAQKGFIKAFSCHHLVAALDIVRFLRNHDQLRQVLRASMRFLYPKQHAAMLGSMDAAVEIPDRKTLLCAKTRLDITCMLASRQMSIGQRVARYVSFDKSPQNIEILVCVEEQVVPANIDTLQRRLAPLSAMAFRHCSVLHTALVLIHKVFLEHGPSEASVRRYFSTVRCVVTDHSSVESEVAELPNLLPAYFQMQKGGRSDLAPEGHLYPVALRVIGVNHTFDTILKYAVNAFTFFPQYQEQAKLLCRFLRNEGYREVLLLRLPANAELSHFGANFAKWRWGALAKVARELARVQQELKEVWDVKLFKGAKDTSLDQISKTIQSDRFWLENKAVDALAGRIEAFRGWSLVCRCHEVECLEAAKKGGTFTCPWKSRRAPELHEEVCKRTAQWRNDMSSFTEQDFACEQVLSEIRHAGSLAEGLARTKFSYLTKLPWLIWQLRRGGRDVARMCLDMYHHPGRFDVSEPHHRVTELFLKPGGEFRRDVEVFASTGFLSSALSQELWVYETAPLSETPTEAPHGQVTRLRKHAPGGRLICWATSLRLGQNLHLYEKYCAEGRQRDFQELWKNYKGVLQRRSRGLAHGRLTAVKMKRSELLKRVYLLGQFGAVDVDWLKGGMTTTRLDGSVPVDDVAQCKVDFLRAILKPSRFYTMRGLAQDVVGAQVPSHSIICFEVLDARISDKKALGSSVHLSSTFPVLLQKYGVWPSSSYEALCLQTRLDVFSEGDVEIVDVVGLSTWHSVFDTILEWRAVGRSDVSGCWQLVEGVDPKRLLDRPGMVEPPALIPLRKLAQAGWQVGSNLASHTADSERKVVLKGVCQRKSYLLCLLKLDILFARGLTSLPVGQNNAYYRAVYIAEAPGDVRPNLRVKDYASMMSSTAEENVESSGDDEMRAPAANEAAEATNPPADSMSLIALLETSVADGLSLQAGAASEASAPAHESQEPSTATRADTILDMLEVSADALLEPTAAPLRQPRGNAFEDLPESIDGIKIIYDWHHKEGKLQYERFGIRCPCASTSHFVRGAPCFKYRNAGANQTSRYGKLEVIGFLGAWVRSANQHADRKAHMADNPNDARVKAYLMDTGLLTSAVPSEVA